MEPLLYVSDLLRTDEYVCEKEDTVCFPGRRHRQQHCSSLEPALHSTGNAARVFSATAERDKGLGRSKGKEQNTVSPGITGNSELLWLSQKRRGKQVPRTLEVLKVLSVTLVVDKLMLRIKSVSYLIMH